MQPVLHFDPTAKFPESNEKPGHFVGFDLCSGDALTFKVMKQNVKGKPLARSVMRPASDCNTRNRRVKFKKEVEEDLEKMDPQHEQCPHCEPLKPALKQNNTESTDDDEVIVVSSID